MSLKVVKDNNADKFNLEYQFQQFLKTTGQKEKDMHPMQRQQIKATFMAAWFRCLQCINLEVAELKEKEQIEALKNMETQALAYFQSLRNQN